MAFGYPSLYTQDVQWFGAYGYEGILSGLYIERLLGSTVYLEFQIEDSKCWFNLMILVACNSC